MAASYTSYDAWTALAHAFSNRSQSRIMSLRERLGSIRNMNDELALNGHPIDNLEMVIHALNGLRPTFRDFTTVIRIRTRDSSIAFNEIYDKLVDFEMFLQREEQISTPAPITANLTQCHYNDYNRGCHHTGRNNHHHNHDSQSRNNYNDHDQTFPNTRNPTSNNIVICQYCEKICHTAK
ncbi:uncharacterized protein LOC127137017 [Lathyrus oleraceus]|uniref:uncharacterized protein LOC127137017 n=1 Tax=Pisum sativum TaxID=3888 RepID=UPI001FC5368B|nr:uncharacterized protein LOC127137017 [Pisum sativum]